MDRPGRVYWRGVTLLEEHEISPTYEIYFTGCSLRCRFCTVPDAIHSPRRGEWLAPEALVAEMMGPGVPPFRAVSLVGGDPGVNLPYIRPLVALLRERLPDRIRVLNTNLAINLELGPEMAQAFNRVVGDLHFWAPGCAAELGGARDYPEWGRAFTHALLSAGGTLTLRVLALPGHLDCCAAPTLRWAQSLQDRFPDSDVTVHLMTHYAPVGRTRGDPVIGRRLDEAERAHLRALLHPETRQPAVEAPPELPGRPAGCRDPAVPVEIDGEGLLFFPFVTGELLPMLAEIEPALRPRLRYLDPPAAPLQTAVVEQALAR